eukprot:10444831-Alexandrium_andersonii.AAC.1
MESGCRQMGLGLAVACGTRGRALTCLSGGCREQRGHQGTGVGSGCTHRASVVSDEGVMGRVGPLEA